MRKLLLVLILVAGLVTPVHAQAIANWVQFRLVSPDPNEECNTSRPLFAMDTKRFYKCNLETFFWEEVPAVTSSTEPALPICAADNADPNARPGAIRYLPAETGDDNVERAGRLVGCVERKDRTGYDWKVFLLGNDQAPE